MPWITTVLLCLSVTLSFVSATAIPLTTSQLSTSSTTPSSVQIRRDDSHVIGMTAMQRTFVSSTVIVCIFLLGVALGTRVKQIDFERFRFIHYLVILQSWLAICFALSVGVIGPGLGIRDVQQCRSSIVICIVFYLVGKLVTYQFLIERAHVIRSAFLTRYHDRVWMAFTSVNVLGMTTLVILASLMPTFTFNAESGTCHIGFNRYVVLSGMSVDFAFNLALTTVFIWLLWPVIRVRVIRSNPWSFNSPSKNTPDSTVMAQGNSHDLKNSPRTTEQDRHESIAAILNRLGARTSSFTRRHKAARSQRSFFTSIRTMLWRNVIGSLAMLVISAINGILFFVWHAKPHAWLCLSLCLIDISFGTLVVHWLTAGGSTIDTHPPRSQSTSQSGHVMERPHVPYSDCSVDAPLPELKTYEEVVAARSESPKKPEQSHGPKHSL